MAGGLLGRQLVQPAIIPRRPGGVEGCAGGVSRKGWAEPGPECAQFCLTGSAARWRVSRRRDNTMEVVMITATTPSEIGTGIG